MIEATELRPLHHRALLRRDDPETERGGIVIAPRYRVHSWNATVVRLGNDVTLPVKEGDKVFYLRAKTVLPFPDRTWAITDGDSILAKLVPQRDFEKIVPFGKYVLIEPDAGSACKQGVMLPQKAVEDAASGTIVRVGERCLDVKPGDRVCYKKASMVVGCVENDKEYRLVSEDDILYRMD